MSLVILLLGEYACACYCGTDHQLLEETSSFFVVWLLIFSKVAG
jgi:hypothetical protein